MNEYEKVIRLFEKKYPFIALKEIVESKNNDAIITTIYKALKIAKRAHRADIRTHEKDICNYNNSYKLGYASGWIDAVVDIIEGKDKK